MGQNCGSEGVVGDEPDTQRGHESARLRLLSLLSKHDGEVCVFELVESFTLEQPTISHHLRLLREAGLVDYHKNRQWVYYYLRREAFERARAGIEALMPETQPK